MKPETPSQEPEADHEHLTKGCCAVEDLIVSGRHVAPISAVIGGGIPYWRYETRPNGRKTFAFSLGCAASHTCIEEHEMLMHQFFNLYADHEAMFTEVVTFFCKGLMVDGEASGYEDCAVTLSVALELALTRGQEELPAELTGSTVMSEVLAKAAEIEAEASAAFRHLEGLVSVVGNDLAGAAHKFREATVAAPTDYDRMMVQRTLGTDPDAMMTYEQLSAAVESGSFGVLDQSISRRRRAASRKWFDRVHKLADEAGVSLQIDPLPAVPQDTSAEDKAIFGGREVGRLFESSEEDPYRRIWNGRYDVDRCDVDDCCCRALDDFVFASNQHPVKALAEGDLLTWELDHQGGRECRAYSTGSTCTGIGDISVAHIEKALQQLDKLCTQNTYQFCNLCNWFAMGALESWTPASLHFAVFTLSHALETAIDRADESSKELLRRSSVLRRTLQACKESTPLSPPAVGHLRGLERMAAGKLDIAGSFFQVAYESAPPDLVIGAGRHGEISRQWGDKAKESGAGGQA